MKKIILFLAFILSGLFVKAQQPYDYYAPIMTDSLAADSNVYIKNVGIRDALFIQYSMDTLLWSNEKIDGWKYYRFSNDLKQSWSRAIGFTTSAQLDSVDYIDFSRIEPPLHRSFRMFADTANSTIAFYNEVTGVSMQIGLEQWTKVWNESGLTTLDGRVVYVDGVEGKYPTIRLADNRNFLTASSILGVVTHDIQNNSFGFVTNSGEVRDLDTSSYPEGETLYLGEDGNITHIKPVHPKFIIEIGKCLHSDVTEGKILVNIKGQVTDVIHNAFNDNFIESIEFIVTSNGSVITGTLQRKGGGDLTMLFNDGFTNLDCTPPQTITLTQGSSTSPLTNYVYVPRSTKQLTISTSDWPAESHIRVAEVAVRTAALTQSDGVLKNQVWNDHLSSDDGSGHVQHLNIRVRRLPADWYSGVEPSVDIQSVPNPDNVYFSVTGGKVFQIHLQNFPAQSLPTNDIHIVNHPVTPYLTLTNLNTLLVDATNTSLSGRSFSFVIWGVQNETDQPSHLMLNLPGGSYTSSTDAINDPNNFSNYRIPAQFRGVGFLIARVTMSHSVANSGTWTLNQLQDLRGLFPNSTAGGGSGGGGGGGGSETFLGLLDTPVSYSGSSDKIVNVNSGETGLVFSNITTSQLTSTINNSHAPVTLGTSNGLSLNVQQLSLGTSSTSTTGALTSTDWNIFNNKEPAITSKGTAFNKSYGLALPSSLGTANVGFKDSLARADHIHPMPTIEVLGMVSISGKATNDILQWNGTNWINRSLSNAGIQPTLTTGNLTENITGLEFSTTRQVIGGAAELRLTTGYMIPTTTQSSQWTGAYNDRITAAAFSGTTTKTLTLTQQDEGIITANFNDLNTTYSISTETTTGGANLRLLGSDTVIDDVKFAGSGNVSIARTDANTITITGTSDNTDAQTLSFNNPNLSISNGNTVNLSALAGLNRGSMTPKALGSAYAGDSLKYSREDHIHPMPTIEVLGLVSVSSKSINDILQWNGTNWVNKSLLNAGIQPSLTTGNLTENITGLEFSAIRQVIGGASELRLTTGYSIPTDLQINDWNTAYGERLSSASFSGTTTKTLTLTKSNTETLQAQFDDNDTKYNISSQVVSGGANLRLSGNDNTTDDVAILGGGTVTVTRTDENTITISATSDNTDAQTLSTNNTPGNISISNGNTITLNVNDADYNPTNEIQQIDTFRIVNNVVELSLSQDGVAKKTIDLSSYVNEDPQTLSLINNSLSISQGNSVDLSGYVNTDSQNLGLGVRSGTSQPITISGGTGVILDVEDNDNDSINEIQTLELTGVQPTISLSKKDDFGGGDIIVKGTGAASVSYEGDTLTINAVSGEVINAFTATIPIISTTMNVTYPTPFPSTNYFLNFNVYYDQVIDGKNVRVSNAIYDYSKTASGFTFKVDTVAGYVELFASDTVNVYPFEYSEADPTVPSHVKEITGTNITNWNTAYGWGNHASAGYLTSETDPTVPSYVKSITSQNITDWGTAYGWGNHASAGYLTGNQSITLSGAVTGSGSTSISTTLANNAVTYAKLGTDMTASNTVSSTVDMSAGGIGKITLSANTAFTFTNFQLNKTYMLIVTANGYTASFAQSSKHIAVEGNATIGTTGVYYISLTCIDTSSGSEKLLTVIMKGA